MALLQGIGTGDSSQEGNDLTVPLSSSDAADIPPRTERGWETHMVTEGFDRANEAQPNDPPLSMQRRKWHHKCCLRLRNGRAIQSYTFTLRGIRAS